MSSLKSEDWSFLAKWLYKMFFRAQLEKAVKHTRTDFDDKMLSAVDKMIGK